MKPKILCPKCETELTIGVHVCPKCGTHVEWEPVAPDVGSGVLRPCPICGTENPGAAEFCNSCGARLQGKKGRGKSAQGGGRGAEARKNDAENTPLFSPKVILGGIGILALFVIAIVFFSDRGQVQAPQQESPAMQQMPTPSANLQVASQITELEKQVAANPSDYKAMLSLANLSHDGRFFDKAITDYKRYLDKNPKDANARVDLGICCFETDKLDEAEKEMKTALKYDPKHLQAHFNLGIVTLKARKLQESNEWFKKTIALAPPNSEMGQQAKQFLEQHSAAKMNK